MKLPIKKKYFDEIKNGKKTKEYRDAHITFVCEETGEKYRMDVEVCSVIDRTQVPLEYRNAEGLTEQKIMKFWLVPSSNSISVKTESFNKDLTATQQVASPKSASQTSLNPDIKSNFSPRLQEK